MKNTSASYIEFARKRKKKKEKKNSARRKWLTYGWEIQSAERRTFNRMAIKVSSTSDYMRPRRSMTVSYISCKESKQPKGGVFTRGGGLEVAAIYGHFASNALDKQTHTHTHTHGGGYSNGHVPL